MHRPQRLLDLVAFVAALLTVITLLLMGVPPESLAIVVVAIAGLYGAWLGAAHGPGPSRGEREQQDPQEPA
jgi:hypothetical protein